MRTLFIAALAVLLSAPLLAQRGYAQSNEPGPPASSNQVMPYGSGSTSSDGSAEQEAGSYDLRYPYNLQILSQRHFDFVVAPQTKPRRGSMEDTSISLGEYARKLRAEKQKAAKPAPQPLPGAMAQPSR